MSRSFIDIAFNRKLSLFKEWDVCRHMDDRVFKKTSGGRKKAEWQCHAINTYLPR